MPSWAGLWDNMHGQAYALLNEPGSTLRGIARLMAPQAVKGQGAIGTTLTGQPVGANAIAIVTQVKSQQADGLNLGGLVPIANQVGVNRATTTADEQLLDAQLNPTFAPANYPVEKSGNSGGGILGTVNK